MLDSIRKRKDNLIYTAMILAVVAVMALYGVNQMNDDQTKGAGIAAWVNGELITQREFQQELEGKLAQYQQLLGGQYDEKFLAALQVPQRTLDELIQYKLLAQQSKKLNILVPDSELADHIRSIPYYQRNGRFDSEGYSRLPNRGVEERMRRERLLYSKFQGYLSERVQLTPAEMRQAFELKETKVDLEYAKIDFNQLAEQNPAPASEVTAFLKAAPESELQQYYDGHKEDFTEKPSVHLFQIRVGVPFQANEAQKAEAKKKIEEIAKETTADAFSEVARKRSDDEYAKKGGDAGWVARGSLEPALEKAIDGLQPGQVSAPLETPFGYFILRYTEKKDQVVHPLADVKQKIAEKLVAEKRKKAFTEGKKAEWDKMLAEGKSIEPELKKLKVEMKKTGPFSVGQGAIPGIGPSEPMVDGVFTLSPKDPVAKQLYENQGSYYFIKLLSVEHPKAADFDKHREAVERQVETALQTELVNQWVKDLQKTAAIKQEVKF